jgi:SAM-dependent methyltransferase
MDRTRFSFIAHRDMDFCSPIGPARVARAIELMGLAPGAEVVDIGAGKCEWLARILLSVPASKGIGVEPAAMFADEAERRHAAYVRGGRLDVKRLSAAAYVEGLGGRKVDAALCIGSTHAFGDHVKTLEALAGLVRPGGVMVVAEGYWKQRPSEGYLKALGGDESDLTTHAGNIERAIERGLTPRWACTVTEDEWDEYEWAYSRGIDSFVREDADAGAMIERSRSWRETYVKWGRETLGFGVYVLGVA